MKYWLFGVPSNFEPSKDAKVTFLATGETIQWEQSGKDMIIKTPVYQLNKMKETDNYAFVFKMSK